MPIRAARLFALLALLAVPPGVARAAGDPAACVPIRLSNVGWTDAEAVTAVASTLFDALGYAPHTPMLALTMTYVAMRDRRVDAFLSNWEPSGSTPIRPFLADGSVERLATNLTGAHYTLAVPDYVWQAGLRDYRDIAAWGSRLGYMIFGLEAGNDGNALVLDMIRTNQFQLQRFRLVESSEQGMLSQVDRTIQSHRPIVFLAWEPHPMNLRFALRYLTGGDRIFGADGGVTVNTVIRRGYRADCPNAARLLARIRFTVPDENIMMLAIQRDHTPPSLVARRWLRDHPDAWHAWLDGVTTQDGAPSLPAIQARLAYGD
ncbi:glycine betaine ABC transporter substrate-binding protein [Gluconacetobacter takamatsuzukensis]|uniref:Glycine/betaine ABC transporter substrate-binding protein n=1 Tax=Gluconacetobacter takamatsuzukensis TaxID=1286190 RepID=A0A7W4KB41_9PROT|nr:glycine betaine ABC transporter substrate-binding protein [Gluconacetobacter takamatsuzukensis]MBB2203642.1 glycine/betaine ABC transporter substrate-binding protein [Gluconacetobacter takamatsuzukensis]